MKAEIAIGTKKYTVDFSKAMDISIALNFNGNQPNTYGVDKASSKAYKDGQFIGDTRKGGAPAILKLIILPHIVTALIPSVSVISQMKEWIF